MIITVVSGVPFFATDMGVVTLIANVVGRDAVKLLFRRHRP